MSLVAAMDLRASNDATSPLANIEAEQALLGVLLYDNGALERLEDLAPEHFYEPFHGRLYDWARQRIRGGILADPIVAGRGFAGDAAFVELGGVRYLADLVDRAPPSANAADYGRVVTEFFGRRALEVALAEALRGVREPDRGGLSALVGDLEHTLGEIARGTEVADSFIAAEAMIPAALDYAVSRSGRVDYPLGPPELDELLGGLNAGEMTILAARPGMGKTVGAQTIARANAALGKGVCFFSLEMAQHPLGLRLASDLAFDRRAPHFSGVTSNPTADAAMKGLLSSEQWSAMRAAGETARGWPLAVDTRPSLTLQQIEAAARRQHRRWERQGVSPGPVIIDHLGRVRPGADRRGDIRAEMVDRSHGASEMAKRLGVPVVALVQLNRGVEGREDKTPGLSDLRQAGELEEDARQVIFLFRPEYYLRPSPGETFDRSMERREKLKDVERKLYWIVAKNSHGPVGQVLTYCDIASSAVRSWEA